VQAARNALSLAKHFNAPLREISSLGLRLMAEKRALHTLKLKKAQQPLLSQASHDGQQPQAAGNMWKLLRSYKTDHAKSNLPQKIYSNASKDNRLWKKGPLTTDPLAWHHYRSALGHHLLLHPQSPFNDSAARTAAYEMPTIIQRIAMPTTSTDPLFIDPLTPEELETELKASPPDKAPCPDGITNHMLRATGSGFRQVLFLMLNTLWHHDRQPEVWQKSLVQRIFKGGGKDRSCPSSFRGIYLKSALAKLLRGSSSTALLRSLKPTTRPQTTNSAPDLCDKPMTTSTPFLPS